LFSDRLVDRQVFGMEVAAPQLQALPAVFVVALAPLMSILWFRLGERDRNPGFPVKFALSLLLVGIGFLMPLTGTLFSQGLTVALFWFVMIYFLMVIGELCQAPIALSMITRLCPRQVVGMMLGSYFVALAVGNILAGELAARYTVVPLRDDGTLVDPAAALATYTSAFAAFGVAAIVTGAVLWLLSPIILKRLHLHDAT